MGFLSKLFGTENASSAAKDFLKDVLQEGINNNTPWQHDSGTGQTITPTGAQSRPAEVVNAPFGVSWGDEMPSEPNQFNFNGNYHQYFESVYREAFPEYEISKQLPDKRNAAVFTFTKDGTTALVVEVISQSSSPYKISSDCARQKIPYLRYYHDHYGWWNTKNYVINRTRHALG